MNAAQSLREGGEVSGNGATMVEPFGQTLSMHGLTLSRKQTTTLQVNVGFLCNQTCRHCHLDAGPDRKENMTAKTMDEVVAYARRSHFETIDITGGAPELNPNIARLIIGLSPLAPRIMIRSNLSALNDKARDGLIELLREKGVVIVASFPSFNEAQTDSLRGKGTFQQSIAVLKKLNALGYGQDGSGLELNLVSNPTGAFLPSSQLQTEKRFREVSKKKWGIWFNNLFNIANVPLGRFRKWLVRSGNFESYMKKLAAGFNSCAVEGLMCRELVSVAWDGHLYDCDFNLARALPLSRRKTHISRLDGPPEPGTLIAVADHCYSCTAGAGFT
jgi:radical SAM/Cys-rich protein